MKNLFKSVVIISLFAAALPIFAQVGSGGAPPPNIVTQPTPAKYANLSWNASTTPNVTYDVYRGTVASGPYGKVNPVSLTATTYRDDASSTPPPAFGTQNFYVVIAKDASNVTSVYSNEVSGTAVAPKNGSPAPPTQVNAVVAVLIKIGKGIVYAITFGRVNLFHS